jgi:hypothetical protein
MTGPVIGGIGLGGPGAQGDDEWQTWAPIPLESRLPVSSVSKSSIENMQFLGFYAAAQIGGLVPGLQSYERTAHDPPDAVITTTEGQELAIELTTLSTTQVTRQRFAEARSIGRALGDRLKANPEAFPHLVGRVVGLSEMGHDDERPPRRNQRQVRQLVDTLATALEVDFGVVQGIPIEDASAGLPEKLTPEQSAVLQLGRRQIEHYYLEVHQTGVAGASPSVVTNVTVTIRKNELRDQLVKLVNTKDDPRNQILLISTGLVDSLGYVGTADRAIFEWAVELLRDGLLSFSPDHLNQVILHHWGSHHFAVLYNRPDSPTLADISRTQRISPPGL